MPICTLCKNKWSWKQTIKKTTPLNPEMSCPYCEGKQFQSKKSKLKIFYLNLIILLPLLIPIIFYGPGIVTLSLVPLLAVIVFLIYPCIFELSSKEEFPF